jgi:hypothetical protein
LKRFSAWAKKHDLTDDLLQQAVKEIATGKVDANLGNNLYKKRIATRGRGKSGSVRTLLTYSANNRTFFLYAFEKNQQANITQKETVALQELGKFYLRLNDTGLAVRLKNRAIIEISKAKEQ